MMRIELLCPPSSEVRHDRKHIEEHREIERPDAQPAPDIKITEIILAAFGVDQYPRDQESGEHEEKVDADPACRPELPQPCKAGIVRPGMRQQHRHDREGAQSIK